MKQIFSCSAQARLLLSGLAICAVVCGELSGAVFSRLWGNDGAVWTPESRLPDFSRAGYHEGEQAIPEVAQVTNVKDFGAIGDGVADDTQAFRAAITATVRGAVEVPLGRYKITDFVRIEKCGVVLRGAGPTKSVLWFPRGLDEIHPKEMHDSRGLPTSGYAFDGAFFILQGNYQTERLARIVAIATRGASAVEVDDAAKLIVGETVMVMMREAKDQSLKTYLYAGDPGDISNGKSLDTKMLLRVVAVHGTRVEFDRPLRCETRAAWQPEIHRFAPTVTECGIEGLGFEFPAAKYRGHFKENGANAIELRSVYDCWVRDVAIRNGDLGINLVACGNTVDGVVFTADPGRERLVDEVPCTGHHAIQCKNAQDNLIVHFDFQTNYIHDLGVEHASGNVYAQGRGTDLCFDHHKDTPYDNLYSDIDCGRGSRVWHCGGGAGIGRQCARGGAFWNIRAVRPIAPPPKEWGAPGMTMVGFTTATQEHLDSKGLWFEVVAPEQLEPRDLHAAQLARRLKVALGK